MGRGRGNSIYMLEAAHATHNKLFVTGPWSLTSAFFFFYTLIMINPRFLKHLQVQNTLVAQRFSGHFVYRDFPRATGWREVNQLHKELNLQENSCMHPTFLCKIHWSASDKIPSFAPGSSGEMKAESCVLLLRYYSTSGCWKYRQVRTGDSGWDTY